MDTLNPEYLSSPLSAKNSLRPLGEKRQEETVLPYTDQGPQPTDGLPMSTETESADNAQIVPIRPREGHPFTEDPYIRSLVIAQTRCFGAHSKKSDICRVCRIERECEAAVVVRLAEISADLEIKEAADAAAAQAKIEKEKAVAAAKAEKAEAIGELISKFDASTSEKYIPPAGTTVGEVTSQGALCLHCKKSVPKGETCAWIRGVGILHTDCCATP